jgi:hypothetical protein
LRKVSGAKTEPNRIGAGIGQGSQANSVYMRYGRRQAQAVVAVVEEWMRLRTA